ncbi:MAG: NAD(P)H-dependent oxidoreductase subunit E [Bacteroidota bacterium]
MEEQVRKIINGHAGNKREDLIPILQKIQQKYNHLPEEAVYLVSQELNIAASKVYSIATFYNLFRFRKTGKYHIQVCRGTACHLEKSSELLRVLEKNLKTESGQSVSGGLFSLETVPCMGACSLSPVIRINDTFYTQVDPKDVKNILETYRKQEEL